MACALIVDRSADGRGKPEVAVIGTLSRLGDAMVRTYLRDLGIEMRGEALLFRTRTEQPYRDTVLSHDFADVRTMVDPEAPPPAARHAPLGHDGGVPRRR